MKRCAVLLLAMCVLPAVANAQQAGSSRERVWVDVNFLSQQPTQGEQVYSATFLVFPGAIVPAATTTTYPAFPTTVGVGFDAGVLLYRGFGVGIHLNRASYDGSIALAATVPHPFVPGGVTGSDTAFIETPRTRESAFDLSAAYLIRIGDGRWQIRLFGGPSYLTVTQSMLNHYSYSQQLDFNGLVNTVTISDSSLKTEEVSESVWGFHAGADVQYFFNRYLGVGGVVRMNRGTVSLTEPLTQATTDVQLGHVSVGGGVRLRF